MNNKKTKKKFPFVSICTITFNRRPFIPYMIKCFEHQTYPRDKIEWIIIDDGTDPIEDLVKHIPQVQYFKYDTKMTIGKKRNLTHSKSSGEIIVYMDDDDYYPPDRISHAVETLQDNPKALCAGSSEMHIYFKHIQKLYKFGPYGPNHSTAATFAFRKELLSQSKYDETACLAEEKFFLKDYTIPFVQLDPTKSILVISHNHNSFDKKKCLDEKSTYVSESLLTVSDFMKEPELIKFYMEDVDALLEHYEPGLIIYKPDVIKQTIKLQEEREQMILDHQKSIFFKMEQQMQEKMKEYAEQMKCHYDKIIADKTMLITEVLKRNKELINKNKDLETHIEKISRYYEMQIEEIKNDK
jgi:glycosyltransferase involved in cell wall biosynthesis